VFNKIFSALVKEAGTPEQVMIDATHLKAHRTSASLVKKGMFPALLADKGYDADWYRDALRHIGIVPCIPYRRNRKTQREYDKALYKRRHKIENAFGKIKDWCAVALRYYRHAHTFLSVITIAAILIFWL
jgi:transposase